MYFNGSEQGLWNQVGLKSQLYHFSGGTTQVVPDGYPDVASGNNPPASVRDARDVGSIPGLGRSPGEGNSNPLQYSCLENPMDRGAWRATVHGVAESDTTVTEHTHSA